MNTLTYRAAKSSIERKSYKSKEDMQQMLDVFLLGERLTLENYNELTDLLSSQV
ncbi:hypothetical protein PQ478_08375 [Alkalihalophilus pseudofirmus]|uniref:hypothetical protein n=1 Tax=Alkalihalophilus pseudofirmus TaxID=79885 RepID=UPI00259BA31C|nr:hypothetical protein [Alkalihalophilus pseudofirmus]WEG18484.1 hypothetical protein PQ478_08375 [Alkalihalophilus pseudofirmus]